MLPALQRGESAVGSKRAHESPARASTAIGSSRHLGGVGADAGWQSPSRAAFTPTRRQSKRGRPYTTQERLAQVFDSTFVRTGDGQGWRQSERRPPQTAGESKTDSYWRHKTLKTATIKPGGGKRQNKEVPDPPEHLPHWNDMQSIEEYVDWCQTYSQRYKDLPPKKWTVEDTFSFVADSFHCPDQVDVSGKILPDSLDLGDAIDFEKRLDTLVLRRMKKQRIDFKKLKATSSTRLSELLHIGEDEVCDIINGIQALGLSQGDTPKEKQDEELTLASAAMLSARREQRDQAAMEAYMISELNLRRERAKLAKVKTRLAPMEKMMSEHKQDLDAIGEHMASVAMRRAASRSRTRGAQTSFDLSEGGVRGDSLTLTRPSTSSSILSIAPSNQDSTPFGFGGGTVGGRPLTMGKSSGGREKGAGGGDGLSAMRRLIVDDARAKTPTYQGLHQAADKLHKTVKSREEEALESRERMRDVERERNARVMRQLAEDDKRREEESKQRMLKMSEADSMLGHAEEVLESVDQHTDIDERAADIKSALRSVQGARSLYVSIGALPQRHRRLVAVERLLDLEYSRRAEGDTHLRIARKLVEGVTVPEGDKPMPKKMTDGALKEAKKALRKAKAEYERTGALDDAEDDIEKVEDMMAHVVEYMARPLAEIQKPEEAEGEQVANEEPEPEEEESEEEDLEPGPDEEQAELFKTQLEQLINFKKEEALSTINDSLYGMQAWLYRARTASGPRPTDAPSMLAAGVPLTVTPSMTAAQSETSTRPTSPQERLASARASDRKLHLASSANFPAPAMGPQG